MMFETMLKVVKGFNKLDGKTITGKSKSFLNKLIRVCKKNGLIYFKEEKGETILFYGDYNKEMVIIREKENRKGDKLYKINFNNLAKEVTNQGIKAGK